MKLVISMKALSAILLIVSVFINASLTLAQETPQLTDTNLTRPNNLSPQEPIINLTARPSQPILVEQLQINPPSCVCTNLNNVTVICEACDRETSVDLCYTHDRACQDAAQMGGIREHDLFFCTTNAE